MVLFLESLTESLTLITLLSDKKSFPQKAQRFKFQLETSLPRAGDWKLGTCSDPVFNPKSANAASAKKFGHAADDPSEKGLLTVFPGDEPSAQFIG